MRIEYTAPTLSHPGLVEFAYRLDGEEGGGWNHLGQNRSLLLRRLSPGVHRLEIGAWSPGSAIMGPAVSLAIRQFPTITETMWFRGGLVATCVAALVLMVWLTMRRSYVRTQRRLELERAVEAERSRIARDIHDDVGAELAQVMLLSQGYSSNYDAGAWRDLLARIHFRAKEITRALDELVWAVNPNYDTVEGFALYVARLAQEAISAAGVSCRLKIAESLPAASLGSAARHHLIMCTKEAIANALKHGSCTQIEVCLDVVENRLRLTVSDNGCGFDVSGGPRDEASDIDHSGLKNMRSRMTELHGTMNLESLPGKGTRLAFEYPLQT